MESLKGFTTYAKSSLRIADLYAIRRNAMEEGLGEAVLDENAGRAVAEEVMRWGKGRVLVVCGSGGKGSIGMAAARHLFGRRDVEILLAKSVGEGWREAAMVNHSLFKGIGEVYGLKSLKERIAHSEIIVDALVGAGLHGKLSRDYRTIVEEINRSGKKIASIDIPSGMDADSGKGQPVAVRPGLLIILQKAKGGVVPAKDCLVKRVEIGVPISAEIIAGQGDLVLATEPKKIGSNKYSNGSILIIGGGKGYSGAPSLAASAANNALAALRTRAGYVSLMVPKGIYPIVATASREAVVRSFSGEAFGAEEAESAAAIRHDAVIIGPGLEDERGSYKLICKFVRDEAGRGKKVLVDATALRALAGERSALKGTIITPHDGEFARISGIRTDKLGLLERAKAAAAFARRYGCVVVLKGNRTIITDGARLKVNRSGSPALATMGSGDVLAGIIAAYATAHGDLFECAVGGVYLHSRVGELLARGKGLHIVASDIVGYLPDALRIFDKVDSDR